MFGFTVDFMFSFRFLKFGVLLIWVIHWLTVIATILVFITADGQWLFFVLWTIRLFMWFQLVYCININKTWSSNHVLHALFLDFLHISLVFQHFTYVLYFIFVLFSNHFEIVVVFLNQFIIFFHCFFWVIIWWWFVIRLAKIV